MTLARIGEIAGNWKTILSLFGLIVVGAVWAADARYVTHKVMKQAEIRQIQRSIQDLEIQKGYATDPRVIQMMEARIKVKENQIKQIETH